jgi:hypothetical protein
MEGTSSGCEDGGGGVRNLHLTTDMTAVILDISTSRVCQLLRVRELKGYKTSNGWLAWYPSVLARKIIMWDRERKRQLRESKTSGDFCPWKCPDREDCLTDRPCTQF